MWGKLMMVGTLAERELFDAIAHLASGVEARLQLVVGSLRNCYGRDDNESRSNIEAAMAVLQNDMEKLPPGINFVTEQARDGVYITSGNLLAIKTFPTYQQARHVHLLSGWLKNRSAQTEPTSGQKYLQVPETRWHLQIGDRGILFMEGIPGKDIIHVLPELSEAAKNGSEAAVQAKQSLRWAVLNNLAWWQVVSEEAAKEFGNYQMKPEMIRQFVTRAFEGSIDALKKFTNYKVTAKQESSVREAGRTLADLISEKPAWAIDLGLRNVRLKMENPNQPVEQYIQTLNTLYKGDPGIPGGVTQALYELDIPSGWNTAHWTRDIARYAFAPQNPEEREEAVRDALYVLRMTEYLKESDLERKMLLEIALNSFRRKATKAGIAHKQLGELERDVYISGAAEAARMTGFIPAGFLSKIQGMLNGRLPRSSTESELHSKYAELIAETRKWAASGLATTDYLDMGKAASGARFLFNAWMEASVESDKLPQYERFMKV